MYKSKVRRTSKQPVKSTWINRARKFLNLRVDITRDRGVTDHVNDLGRVDK